MVINKIGYDHLEIGNNCQDYGIEKEGLKIVCDGCSEGKHSEVGAKLYCHLSKNDWFIDINDIFDHLTTCVGDSTSIIKDFLCFTILEVQEVNDKFIVSSCGDGYIILQDIKGNIIFEELNDGDYPKYYAYNYCNPETLKHYKDGVEFDIKVYSKDEYKNVGVASDGLRFLFKPGNEKLEYEFIDLLKEGKEVKIKRFINRNQKVFKDDITIVF